MATLKDLLSNTSPTGLGFTDLNREEAYRRGYHHAIAEVARVLHCTNLNAEDLDAWIKGAGIRWRKDLPLDRKIAPPELI